MTEENQIKPSKTIGVSVPNEMFDWLEKHPEINRSREFQDKIVGLMHPVVKRISPQVTLMVFMNMVIALGVISSSFFLFVENIQWRFILIFLGMVLALGSLLTYRGEKKNIAFGYNRKKKI
jgi:hypothetical protein